MSPAHLNILIMNKCIQLLRVKKTEHAPDPRRSQAVIIKNFLQHVLHFLGQPLTYHAGAFMTVATISLACFGKENNSNLCICIYASTALNDLHS